MIEHLVLAAGGPIGFSYYGALKYLHKKQFWKLENIKTIYGTSIGAYIGFILSLNFDWDTTDDYLIKRPWEKIANIGPENLYDAYNKKGIVSEDFIHKSIIPLLQAKDLSENITLKEFYNYTKIEFHMYTIDINLPDFTKVDLSYKTHPNMTVIQSLNATMALPLIIPPLCLDDHCYIDGAYTHTLPLSDCLNQQKCENNNILVCRLKYGKLLTSNITKESNITIFASLIIHKIANQLNTEKEQPDIENTIYCKVHDKNITDWMEILLESDKRAELIEEGKKSAKYFFKKNIKK
jgi:predicted acylesterase/phospholipase RssA